MSQLGFLGVQGDALRDMLELRPNRSMSNSQGQLHAHATLQSKFLSVTKIAADLRFDDRKLQ